MRAYPLAKGVFIFYSWIMDSNIFSPFVRPFLAFVLCLALSPAMAQAAPSSEPAARITEAWGDVRAVSQKGERALRDQAPLYVEDVVKTLKGARATFEFLDGATVSMGELSEISIKEYAYHPEEENVGSMLLGAVTGVFRFISGALTRKDETTFSVETPLMTVGIRGTELGLEASPDKTLVAVFAGGPVLAFDVEFKKTFEVAANEFSAKSPGEEIKPPQTVTGEMRETFEKALAPPQMNEPPSPPAKEESSQTLVDILLYVGVLAILIYFVFFK